MEERKELITIELMKNLYFLRNFFRPFHFDLGEQFGFFSVAKFSSQVSSKIKLGKYIFLQTVRGQNDGRNKIPFFEMKTAKFCKICLVLRLIAMRKRRKLEFEKFARVVEKTNNYISLFAEKYTSQFFRLKSRVRKRAF